MVAASPQVPVRAARGKSSSSGAGLNPEESFGHGFFRTFPQYQKCAKGARQSSAHLLSHMRGADAGTSWRPGSSSDWCRLLTVLVEPADANATVACASAGGRWRRRNEDEDEDEDGYEDEDVYEGEPLVDRFARAAVRPSRLCVFHMAGRARSLTANMSSDSGIGDPGRTRGRLLEADYVLALPWILAVLLGAPRIWQSTSLSRCPCECCMFALALSSTQQWIHDFGSLCVSLEAFRRISHIFCVTLFLARGTTGHYFRESLVSGGCFQAWLDSGCVCPSTEAVDTFSW